MSIERSECTLLAFTRINGMNQNHREMARSYSVNETAKRTLIENRELIDQIQSGEVYLEDATVTDALTALFTLDTEGVELEIDEGWSDERFAVLMVVENINQSVLAGTNSKTTRYVLTGYTSNRGAVDRNGNLDPDQRIYFTNICVFSDHDHGLSGRSRQRFVRPRNTLDVGGNRRRRSIDSGTCLLTPAKVGSAKRTDEIAHDGDIQAINVSGNKQSSVRLMHTDNFKLETALPSGTISGVMECFKFARIDQQTNRVRQSSIKERVLQERGYMSSNPLNDGVWSRVATSITDNKMNFSNTSGGIGGLRAHLAKGTGITVHELQEFFDYVGDDETTIVYNDLDIILDGDDLSGVTPECIVATMVNSVVPTVMLIANLQEFSFVLDMDELSVTIAPNPVDEYNQPTCSLLKTSQDTVIVTPREQQRFEDMLYMACRDLERHLVPMLGQLVDGHGRVIIQAYLNLMSTGHVSVEFVDSGYGESRIVLNTFAQDLHTPLLYEARDEMDCNLFNVIDDIASVTEAVLDVKDSLTDEQWQRMQRVNSVPSRESLNIPTRQRTTTIERPVARRPSPGRSTIIF